jgi:hypothetical protein
VEQAQLDGICEVANPITVLTTIGHAIEPTIPIGFARSGLDADLIALKSPALTSPTLLHLGASFEVSAGAAGAGIGDAHKFTFPRAVVRLAWIAD